MAFSPGFTSVYYDLCYVLLAHTGSCNTVCYNTAG